ncbi:hypothetical protein GCM10010340_35360 [Streptomyces griseoloalbus]|nr:hypothetical protein GCM10010340_35360 [Streptomyces albaduncus]
MSAQLHRFHFISSGGGALYTMASIDAVIPAHPEVDWHSCAPWRKAGAPPRVTAPDTGASTRVAPPAGATPRTRARGRAGGGGVTRPA